MFFFLKEWTFFPMYLKICLTLRVSSDVKYVWKQQVEGTGSLGSYLGLIYWVKRKNKRVGEFHRHGESEERRWTSVTGQVGPGIWFLVASGCRHDSDGVKESWLCCQVPHVTFLPASLWPSSHQFLVFLLDSHLSNLFFSVHPPLLLPGISF